MIKRILAAFAVTMLGVLAFATPAHATIPEIQLPWEVSFSDDDCSGLTKVTLTNNLPQGRLPGIGLVFTINGDPIPVGPDSSKVVDVVWPNSTHIVVDLTGAFDPGSDDEATAKSLTQIATHWEHDWQRPAGCWKVSVKSQCNGDQELTVVNTAPAPGDFVVQVDTTAAVEVHVAGNATFTATYPGEPTVTVTVDKETTSTFPFKAPICPSPVPTPFPTGPAPNPGGGDVLPVTGQSLQGEITVATVAGIGLLLLGAGWAVRVLKRRRRQAA